MFRRILVPTDGSKQALNAFRYAVGWARSVEGTIVALHVIDIKLLEGPLFRDVGIILGMTPWTNYQNQIRMLLEERGRQALEVCEKECLNYGIRCEKVLLIGGIARTIVEQSELTDMIILGKSGEHSRWLDGFLGGTAQSVVRRSRRPVLITEQSEFRQGDIMVGYDGSTSSKEALRIGVELAKLWSSRCHIVYVSTRPEEEIPMEAEQYVRACGIDFQTHVVSEKNASIGLINASKTLVPAVIVIGAYGKRRVQEWILGSTTSSLIHTSQLPVLLIREN